MGGLSAKAENEKNRKKSEKEMNRMALIDNCFMVELFYEFLQRYRNSFTPSVSYALFLL